MNEETRRDTLLGLENFASTKGERKQKYDIKAMQFEQDATRKAEPLQNYLKVDKTENPLIFRIVHKTEPINDRTCELKWLDPPRKTKYEWKGLPQFMQVEITKFKLTDMRKNPQFCLALLLQQAKDEMETLRPLADLQ